MQKHQAIIHEPRSRYQQALKSVRPAEGCGSAHRERARLPYPRSQPSEGAGTIDHIQRVHDQQNHFCSAYREILSHQKWLSERKP